MTRVVIIGAGPYGLSVAAHLRAHGVAFRIFGAPLDSWRNHMPVGMMLKSDGFASGKARLRVTAPNVELPTTTPIFR